MQSSVTPFPQRGAVRSLGVSKVPTYIRSLAAGLMWSLQVREGLGLVPLLGHGDEQSNQRAIETWLMTHYDEAQLGDLDKPLDILSKALKRHIEEYNDNLEVCTC
ncbi:MAG: hypothetical protein OQK94_00950 [Gammaproteobacteria bacterium]|nr:hypothetical protein [Gammaproteobacteria bacterium]MCW8839878.1 hypothetical protein [Gammaproteobacteria bacterium]MCW8958920.1 hypothetical protein [Gammaproteobacteria bacterium]MCW8992406.1 hypothetical protein [Gammaproteobacteria bacterium]